MSAVPSWLTLYVGCMPSTASTSHVAWDVDRESRPGNQAREWSVILCTGAVGIDLLDTSAGECGELFHNRAVDQDAQTMTAHRAMLQRPTIDDNLARLISSSLKCGG